ncbi:MAG: signal peptide peptidase SppA, partial [Candidatus Sumerlaeia bacterium]|nr:signal peptide peptidase SppA [Candidatus Sumerlaeia bacterium]
MTEFENKETRGRKRKPVRCLVITIILGVVLFLVIYGVQGLVGSISGKISSVAVLSIEGDINDNIEEKLDHINKYRDNPGVKALVLKIDSPGGSVGAVQELYSELLKLKTEQKKPIVAALGNIAASGGYYIACAADEIITNPGTITGSIGVIMVLPNLEELIRKLGINMEVVKSGKFKDIGSPTRPMTPEEQKLLAEVINDVYEQFFDAVYT